MGLLNSATTTRSIVTQSLGLTLALAMTTFSQVCSGENARVQSQAGAKTQRGASERMPLFVQLVPTFEDKVSPGKNEKDKLDTGNQDEKLVTATYVLAGITAVLALFTAGLWYATYRLVKEAKETARAQLRAYISCTPDYIFNFSRVVPAEMRYTSENYGLTPARKYRWTARVDILPYPLPPNFNFPALPPIREGTFALHTKQSVQTSVFAERPFSDQEIRDVSANNGRRIYCYGITKYEDTFGHEHTTKFCRSIVGSADLLTIGTVGLDRKVDLTYDIADLHNEAD